MIGSSGSVVINNAILHTTNPGDIPESCAELNMALSLVILGFGLWMLILIFREEMKRGKRR